MANNEKTQTWWQKKIEALEAENELLRGNFDGIPIEAVLLVIGVGLRMLQKAAGLPDLPTGLPDDFGNMWIATADWKNRRVLLHRRGGHFQDNREEQSRRTAEAVKAARERLAKEMTDEAFRNFDPNDAYNQESGITSAPVYLPQHVPDIDVANSREVQNARIQTVEGMFIPLDLISKLNLPVKPLEDAPVQESA